jgi:hypothetical protein
VNVTERKGSDSDLSHTVQFTPNAPLLLLYCTVLVPATFLLFVFLLCIWSIRKIGCEDTNPFRILVNEFQNRYQYSVTRFSFTVTRTLQVRPQDSSSTRAQEF